MLEKAFNQKTPQLACVSTFWQSAVPSQLSPGGSICTTVMEIGHYYYYYHHYYYYYYYCYCYCYCYYYYYCCYYYYYCL